MEFDHLVDKNGRELILDDEEQWVVEGLLFSTDFLVIDGRCPGREFWKKFPFETAGIEFRQDPADTEGWSDFTPFLEHVRFLSIDLAVDSVDLSFLSEARSLVALSAPRSSTPVDVSHLSLTEFWGTGEGLIGLFALPTLRRLSCASVLPTVPIIAALEWLRLLDVPSSADISIFRAASSVRELIFASGSTWDVSRLSIFSGLRRLSLVCDSLTHVGALAGFPELIDLDILNCRKMDNISDLDLIRGVNVTVGEENVFDRQARTHLLELGRANWVFGSIPGSVDGLQTYLLHPGLNKALRIPDEVDESGPGELLSAKWERLDHDAQLAHLQGFAVAILREMARMGVTTVVNAHTGSGTSLTAFAADDLLNFEDSVDLSFETAVGEQVGRVVDSLSDGFVLRSPKRPPMKRFRA
jgi:hypothetical protein